MGLELWFRLDFGIDDDDPGFVRDNFVWDVIVLYSGLCASRRYVKVLLNLNTSIQ